MGLRHIFDERFILGANLFYDRYESEHDRHYNQMGYGLELLSPWLDARCNYYDPLDGPRQVGLRLPTGRDVDYDPSGVGTTSAQGGPKSASQENAAVSARAAA